MKNINSLKKTPEFKEVYEKGSSKANSLLVVYLLHREGETRIGISVSKRVGNSVERHRAARLIRESYLSVKEELPENFWIVVIARAAIRGRAEGDVEAALRSALKRHEIL